ncbi:MAG: NAD(P)/FAD-dependent oxidoreductase [Candidatus Omnitrophota bacterium]
MEKVEAVIIGAGIVGLSVAAGVSRKKSSVYLLERHRSFGQETSARNSEVIHAGIYYPKGSLKAGTCIEGNRLVYEICEKNRIPYKRLGKLIVAVDPSEKADLEALFENARANGVNDIDLLDKDRVKDLEPNITACEAIYSGTTGIVDTHKLMSFFAQQAKENGASISYDTEVIRIEHLKEGYKITVKDTTGEDFQFLSQIVINCAGLESDTVAGIAGIDIDKADYKLKYCKGQYFKLGTKKSSYIKRLIYPVPKPKATALGIHATPNLSGMVRLGPDEKFIDRGQIDYNVDEEAKGPFYDSCSRFLPFLDKEDLSQDTSGVRPKLQGEGELFRDFVIKEESEKGLPGFINLIGIESPGLTAAPAIAGMVLDMIR